MAKTQKPAQLSGSKTYSENIEWESLVAEDAGQEYPFFFHVAYEFSRKNFIEDDNSGVYSGPPYPE